MSKLSNGHLDLTEDKNFEEFCYLMWQIYSASNEQKMQPSLDFETWRYDNFGFLNETFYKLLGGNNEWI